MVKIEFKIEHNDSCVFCIADVDVLVVYKYAFTFGELIRNTMLVYELFDFRDILGVAVKHDHPAVTLVGNVELAVGSDEQIRCVAERRIHIHRVIIYFPVGNVCRGRIGRIPVHCISIGLIRS